jgi:YEATS domain-containing protein 4
MQVTHGIKLYPPGTSANVAPTNTEVPVVSELYDEIVFTNPSESFFRDVLAINDVPSIEHEYTQSKYFTKFSDTADMHTLLEAQKFIEQQLQITKERYVRLNEELEAVDIEIENAVLPSPPPTTTTTTTPLPATQSSSTASQPTQSSTSASSKPRNNTGGSTKPRTNTKNVTKGTKNKALPVQAQPPSGGTSATTTGTATVGKKAKIKNDSKSQANMVTTAAAAAPSTLAATTATKEKSTS